MADETESKETPENLDSAGANASAVGMFFQPKRKAPARIVFGGDDDREMWTWECLREHERGVVTFDDVTTFAEAVTALGEHVKTQHPQIAAPVVVEQQRLRMAAVTYSGEVGPIT